MKQADARELGQDYAACEQVLTRSGSSFALPIRLLPAAKRRATTALYALCRVADDITDAAISPPTASSPADHGPREALDRLRQDLDVALDGRGASPVLRAVADAARRYGIPRYLLHDVVDGVAVDLTPRRFERFEDLEDYCRKVASAVGLAAIHIWGFRSEAALVPGHACGVAFQLTNILRDVREDAAAGRLYLPLEDFTACNADPGAVMDRGHAEGLACVLDRSVARARRFFDEAAGLDPLLSTDGRLVFRAMYGTYSAIFRRIAAAPARVLAGRVMPSKGSLAVAAAACILLGPRRVNASWRRP